MAPKTIEGNLVDHRLIRALGHPIRVRALTILNERVASPNELARQLGAHLGSVSYHVRILLELGAIELVKTEPRRGAGVMRQRRKTAADRATAVSYSARVN